jgi:glycosyltransferase involved in cell wall biosynthesis
MPEDAQVRLKRALHAWRSHRQPVVVTHDLADDANDPVLKHVRHRGLFNAGDDPVKVVFHPQFVTATSPVINLDYEQFVRGCHMGIFPSYYEPWGYTPMECVALGLPAITTDLSGFGAYAERHVPNHDEQGVVVLNRRTRSFDQTGRRDGRLPAELRQPHPPPADRIAEPGGAIGRAVRLERARPPLRRGAQLGLGADGGAAAGVGAGADGLSKVTM